MTRYVVTGAGGQLGHDLVAALSLRGADVIALDRASLDVTDRAQVHSVISELSPDIILHAAAMTAVDACETERDAAFASNGLAPRWVIEAAERGAARVVLFSTDYVFSGELDRAYTEWDLPDPRSVYGLSKLAGEQTRRPGDLVIRTSWLCGAHGSNMVKTVLGLARQNKPMAFVTDQIGNPSFTADVAAKTLALVDVEASGVAHVTNAGAVSWYEFVRGILTAGGHDGDLVSPITTAELDPPRPAPRPANSVLDNVVVRLLGLPEARPWEEALAEMVSALDG